MKQPFIHKLIVALISLSVFSACRKEAELLPHVALKDLPIEARQNNLAGLPGAVHRHAANSPIHWQPWTVESIKIAQESDRIIFAVIALAQASGFAESLDALAEDPALVELINSTYVPILVDGDAAREMGILAADLSREINQNVNLPFFIWMSPDADPVAWIGSSWVDNNTTRDHFRQSHVMVSNIWNDSSEYVKTNSAVDNQARYERLSRRSVRLIESEDSKGDTVRSIRQLASLYDPLSRNHDEIGGLFPVSTLDLLASAAMQPDLPEEVRRRAEETTRDLIKDLMPSAMFDPLDGGLFSARRGASWALPRYTRNSIMQARAAVALFRMYQATGEEIVLERALGVLNFNEKNFQTRDGLFAIGHEPRTDAQRWLWSVEDVERILGPEDGQWWASLTNMRALGNIPYEIDTQREFFRSNSIALKKSLRDLAADEGVPYDTFIARFESAREKLFAARVERIGEIPVDENAYAVASFRMVSAYAAAYSATADEQWRNKAVELLARSREAFSESVALRVYAEEGPPSINDARAFVYAVAMQAILDVVDVTGDLSWLDWCDNLATIMTEKFTREHFLREVSEEAYVLSLPMTDLVMLFEDSTVGLMNFAECRLAARERPLLRELRELAGMLPASSVNYPVQHSDIVQSFLARHYGPTIVYGEQTSPELLSRIQRLPIRLFHRRTANARDNLPANGCLVIRPALAEPIPVMDVADLENAFLPNKNPLQ